MTKEQLEDIFLKYMDSCSGAEYSESCIFWKDLEKIIEEILEIE